MIRLFRRALSAMLIASVLILNLSILNSMAAISPGTSKWGAPAPNDFASISDLEANPLGAKLDLSGSTSGTLSFSYSAPIVAYTPQPTQAVTLQNPSLDYILIKAGKGYWVFSGTDGHLVKFISGGQDGTPDNYSVSVGQNSFSITSSNNAKTISHVTLFFSETQSGNLTIIKTDAATGAKLAGAVFTVYSDAACQSSVGTITTGTNGKGTLSGLNPGTYYVVETTAPEGYHLDSTVHSAVVPEGNTVEIPLVDNAIQPGSLTIIKSDADTRAKLAGAVFTVYSDAACQSSVGTITTGANGKGTLSGLKPGTYYVVETTAPEGYHLDSTVHSAVVPEGATVKVKLGDNAILNGSLSISKTDASTGTALAGAVFTVYSDAACQTSVGTITTGSDGTGTLDGLKPGTYYVVETTAPEGYHLDSTVHSAVVPEGDTVEVPLVDNAIQPGSLTIIKSDADTRAKLAGAVFTVYSDAACQSSVGTITTGTNGKGTLSGLKPGTYYVVETTAPEGYHLDSTVHSAVVPEGATVKVKLGDNAILNGSLSISKTDASTGAALAGAVFTVYSDEACQTSVGTITTGSDGAGMLDGLKPGAYYVVETTAPEGYHLDSTVHSAEVPEGETITLDLDNNAILNSSLSIMKTDKATGAALAGAVFTVYSDAACQTSVGTITTGSDGTGMLDGLKPGTYYVVETTAPEGYHLDSTVHSAEVPEGETITLDLDNNAILNGSLSISKTDASTGAALAGAVFTVYSDEACQTSVGTITTGSDGTGMLDGLKPGTYYVVETTAPDGYHLDGTVHSAVVPEGETVIVNLDDQAILNGSLSIAKTDASTGAALAGAVFTVYSDAACQTSVGTITTGSDGTGTLDGLKPGTYYVVETTAPDGYRLDSTVHSAVVPEGETVLLQISDYQDTNPKTGSSDNLSLFFALMILSGFAGVRNLRKNKLCK